MRRQYLERQKSEYGRPVLACLPIYYPKEIFTAMNICMAEVWGPPGQPHDAEMGRIQTYVCPVVRHALSFLAGGGADVADGLFFPHTCDSIQGLATVLPDLGGWDKPEVKFIHPRGPRRDSTTKYLHGEFRSLAKKLEVFTNAPLDEKKLRGAIELHTQIDRLAGALIAKRAYLDVDDRTLYGTLRKGEYLWPEDFLAELKKLETHLKDDVVQTGTPVMISGIVPEPMSIYDNLAEAGAYVAADDYAALGRRIVANRPPTDGDVWDILVETYYNAPPCSTRALTIDLRQDYLAGLLKQSGAKGVIFHNVKFCEPELYDIPQLKKRFAELKLPVLYMESELEPELSGQSITRLEAFVEMASQNRSEA